MKLGWGKYATKTRLLEKGYLRKHRNGSKSREAAKTGYCNCVFCSPKEQEEIAAMDHKEKMDQVQYHFDFMEEVKRINEALNAANEEIDDQESYEQFHTLEDLKPKKENKMVKEMKKEHKKESKSMEKKEERKEERKEKKK